MPRPRDTYRCTRRNEAKRSGLVWRLLDRQRTAEGSVIVHVPKVWRAPRPAETVR